MPGSLPVLNRQVVNAAMAVGLATNCTITQYCKFDREKLFLSRQPAELSNQPALSADLQKRACGQRLPREKKSVGIHEIHMEEDAGKLIHDEWEDCSLVDYNRSGVPLIEIVSEPDMRSAEEVIAYSEKLRMIVQYLGASDCKLNEKAPCVRMSTFLSGGRRRNVRDAHGDEESQLVSGDYPCDCRERERQIELLLNRGSR